MQTGRFSELIHATTRPRELALFDLTDQLLRHPIRERQGVRFFVGDSSSMLRRTFRTSTSTSSTSTSIHLEGVWRDVEVAKRKVKSDGFLVFDDYTLFSPYEDFAPYGVVQCVNHLCVTENWELVFYAFRSDYAGYDNVALRRMRVAGTFPGTGHDVVLSSRSPRGLHV